MYFMLAADGPLIAAPQRESLLFPNVEGLTHTEGPHDRSEGTG